MTLIELLVVVSILMILTVIVLPRVQPAAETRAVREAARSVDIFLATARNEAVATGRPVGVLLRRHDTEPNACTTLEQVEIPPPYAGDTIGAAIRVQDWTVANSGTVTLRARVRLANPGFANGLIRPGDLLQINGQGPVYNISLASTIPIDNNYFVFHSLTDYGDGWSAEYFVLTVDATSIVRSPWPYRPTGGAPDIWSNPVGFSIARQPYVGTSGFAAIASAVEPLELPSGTAVDLYYSGADNGSSLAATTAMEGELPIVMMFSPNGSLTTGYLHGTPRPITEPVFLLIGRWDRLLDMDGNFIPDGGEDGLANWQDLNNYWVTVNPQSGLVTTSEMAAASDADPTNDVDESRAFARQSRRMGGR